MKLTSMICPSCGSPVQVPEGKSFFFCTICGTQIHVDDGVVRVDITKRIVDEAKLKELDMKEQQRLREEEQKAAEERQKQAQHLAKQLAEKKRKKHWFIALGIWMLSGIFLSLMMLKGKMDDLIGVWAFNAIIGSVILTVCAPHSLYSPNKPPSVGTKVGLFFLIYMVGDIIAMLIGALLNFLFIGSIWG